MVIIRALLAGLVGVSLCMANISGTVTDTSGITPIAGVVVKLQNGGQKDTTEANGSFTIITNAALNNLAKQAKATAAINDVITATKDNLLNYRGLIRNSDTSGIKIKMIANAGNVTDADLNVYQSVRIGNQVWTVENWRSTKYADGTAIPLVTGDSAWAALTTPGYCYYNNATQTDTIKKWGALYNWYVVSPNNSKKIAPTGWRIPTTADWSQLQTYLMNNRFNYDGTTGGNKMAKSLAERTDWASDNNAGTPGNDLSKNNASGFTALPGGARNESGTFFEKNQGGCFWSVSSSSGVDDRHLDFNSVDLHIDGMPIRTGVSIRLLKE